VVISGSDFLSGVADGRINFPGVVAGRDFLNGVLGVLCGVLEGSCESRLGVVAEGILLACILANDFGVCVEVVRILVAVENE